MRFSKYTLLLLLREIIWSTEILAATVPLIIRRDQDKIVVGKGTDTQPNSTSHEPGLGSDAVNEGHGQPHEKGFFDATPKNIRASGFGAAYVKWIIAVDKSSTAWQERLSEPDFFAKTVLHWPDDVDCGIGLNGCHRAPTCNDISQRIENRTRARQICYIFDSFHNVNLITAQIHVNCPRSL